MSKVKRGGNLTKKDLEAVANEGNFIHNHEYIQFKDLDGKEAKRYLESKGFKVVENYDAKTNGWAITDCGIWLSTNGYIYKKHK